MARLIVPRSGAFHTLMPFFSVMYQHFNKPGHPVPVLSFTRCRSSVAPALDNIDNPLGK